MLPYIEHPALDLGFARLTAYQVLALSAIAIQYWIVTRRAPLHGISKATASSLTFWAIVLGLLIAFAFGLLAHPAELRESPSEALAFWRGSSMGWMLGGLAALLVLARHRGLAWEETARLFDCVLFALPFTLTVGRLGCALQHCHRGIQSDHWLAVRFPEGARFDLGLLEFFFVAALAVFFLLLDRKRRPTGLYAGLFCVLYAPARFAMDTLRTGEVRYLGFTPAQYLTPFLALAGLALLVSLLATRGGRRSGPSELEA